MTHQCGLHLALPHLTTMDGWDGKMRGMDGRNGLRAPGSRFWWRWGRVGLTVEWNLNSRWGERERASEGMARSDATAAPNGQPLDRHKAAPFPPPATLRPELQLLLSSPLLGSVSVVQSGCSLSSWCDYSKEFPFMLCSISNLIRETCIWIRYQILLELDNPEWGSGQICLNDRLVYGVEVFLCVISNRDMLFKGYIWERLSCMIIEGGDKSVSRKDQIFSSFFSSIGNW